jgi:hypothetical protein
LYRICAKVTDTAVEPSNVLESSTEKLNELSQQLLRGGRGIDSEHALSNVKGIVAPLLERIQNIRHNYDNGDKEKAAAALKTIVGDTAVTSSHLSVSSETPTSIQLRDVPDGKLAEFIDPQVLKQLDENAQELLTAIDETLPNLTLLTATKKKKRSYQTQSKSSQSDQKFFDSKPSEFGFNGGGAYSALHGDHQSYAKFFNHHQHSHRFLKDHKTGGRMDSIFLSPHRHPYFSKHSDAIMAKHQIRLEALGEKVCAPVCEPNNWECNCRKLFSCVDDMTEYSLAVLIAGGFIETDPMSNNFGNFTVSSNAMNLFDAEEGVKDKLKRIQGVARNGVTIDNCKAVLSDLFTACDGASSGICTNPNIESFAVSTNQVCAVVNTATKLKFETVGDEFDGFVDDSVPGKWVVMLVIFKFLWNTLVICSFLYYPLVDKCEPLSVELCKDFVVQFDRLYEAGPGTNPMRQDPSVSLYDKTTQIIFNHVQFPVNYWFPQDSRGVVDRTAWPTTSIKSSFAIVNHETGKALTLRGTDCGNVSRIDLEDHDPSNLRQHFQITDDGNFFSASCPRSVESSLPLYLSTDYAMSDSCISGGLLYLDSDARSQRWKLGAAGSIVLNSPICSQYKLANLAISAIKDDDIENMLDTTVYVSIVNPASGMVRIEALIMRNIDLL